MTATVDVSGTGSGWCRTALTDSSSTVPSVNATRTPIAPPLDETSAESDCLGPVRMVDLRTFRGMERVGGPLLGELALAPVAVVDNSGEVRVMVRALIESGVVTFDTSFWTPFCAAVFSSALRSTTEHAVERNITPLDIAQLCVAGGPSALKLLDSLMGATEEDPPPDFEDGQVLLADAIVAVYAALDVTTNIGSDAQEGPG